MGRSYTCHVVGEAVSGALHGAMSRAEMAQQCAKAQRADDAIIGWSAQTKTGARILGGEWALTSGVKLPRMVDCPICESRGCPVCEFSGMCRPGHWERWQEWQLDQMRQEHGKTDKFSP